MVDFSARSRISWVTASTTVRGGGGGRSNQGHVGTSAVSGVVRYMGSATVGGAQGVWVMGASVTGGMGSQVHCQCCPVTFGHAHCCSKETEVICTTSPAATRFSGAAVSAAAAGAPRTGDTASTVPLLPPPLCVPVHPHLDAQIYRIFSILVCKAESCFWIVNGLLVVDWGGGIKGTSHSIMMLMSSGNNFYSSNSYVDFVYILFPILDCFQPKASCMDLLPATETWILPK